MENTNVNIDKRKPFPKPRITKVRLVAEEAVLAECKNVGIQSTCDVADCGNFDTGS